MFAALNLGEITIGFRLMNSPLILSKSFCGTTTEFCGDGCISGCEAVDEPYDEFTFLLSAIFFHVLM